ncbi:phosphotransferase [Candidatus Poribacteria bacterium]|nr:phosphotransferase [Candidatus Poribacteria bacterium]
MPTQNLNLFEVALSRLQAHLAVNQPGTQIIPLSPVERQFSKILRIQLKSEAGDQFLLMKQYRLPQDGLRQVMIGEQLQKDYATMERLYRHWKDSPQFAVPCPTACYPDLLTLVMEECEGETVSVILGRNAPFFPSKKTIECLTRFCHLCGKWLKANHESDSIKKQFATYSMGIYLDYNDIRLQSLVQYAHIPLEEPFRKKILQYMQRRWVDVDPSETYAVEVHGDYSPGNVMTDGKKLIIIDLANAGQGSIYHDLSRFYHQLDMYLFKPIFRPRVIRRLQRALLDGYNPKLEIQNPLFELMLVQHTLCHLMGIGRLEQLPAHERWYNRRIIRRHIRWLKKLVNCA